jgi:hypothetical protein
MSPAQPVRIGFRVTAGGHTSPDPSRPGRNLPVQGITVTVNAWSTATRAEILRAAKEEMREYLGFRTSYMPTGLDEESVQVMQIVEGGYDAPSLDLTR